MSLFIPSCVIFSALRTFIDQDVPLATLYTLYELHRSKVVRLNRIKISLLKNNCSKINCQSIVIVHSSGFNKIFINALKF
jgi:hypothetical protein